jgi:DNA-binding beta-propeller fold protein YncE
LRQISPILKKRKQRMKAFFSIAIIFIIALASGCLGSSNSSIAPNLAFVYVVGQGGNTILALGQRTTGELSPLPLSSFPTNPRPVALTLHPSKNFLYAANVTANTVAGFAVDHTNGVLTPIGTALPPTPVCASSSICANPVSLGINSAGTFLFVLNQGVPPPATVVPASISVFSIDTARGLLTPIAGSPFSFASLSTPNPQMLAVSPSASALYVSNGASGTVSAFTIASDGSLSEIAGSPFTAGANIAGITMDSKGQFLYAADFINSKIASFSIQSGGALAPVAGSPVATGIGPVALAVDNNNAFLFSAEQGAAGVSVFKISAGALTKVAGSPFPVVSTGSPQPSFVAVDTSNTFLYVANSGTRNITGYTIKPDGTLTPLPASPFPLGLGPQWIVITR